MASLIRWLAMALMAVAVEVMPGSGPGVATADDYVMAPRFMEEGWSLSSGMAIASDCCGLHVQHDCNLVLYPKGQFDKPMWASQTAGKGDDCTLILQEDCNAVLYITDTQTALWSSQTAGQGTGCELWLQDDGNLVLYDGDGAPKWSSQTKRS